MGTHKIKIGIIGGSGLDDFAKNFLIDSKVIERENVISDFGYPSSDIYQGTVSNIPVALIFRHGVGHTVSPTNVNYRGNVEALKNLGCTHILASTACGSLSASIGPGQLVIPDNFIDCTTKRDGTFFDGTSAKFGGVRHVPMEPSFHPATADSLLLAAQTLGLDVKKGGTIVAIEGPRFSSRAESKTWRLWGGDLINMTTCPEVCLAKEAGLLYAAVAIATDYDSWREPEEFVSATSVMSVFKENAWKVKNLLVKAIEIIGNMDWDQHINDLKDVIDKANVSKN
ncbi:S-methyl-5'-thioadenosine phosphorylase [Fopius arisanus]|uniref:S-methyl-5'-thioadenosine phosphorylase n=1 Tax=Fopius arisanus TaxID=64838 RepID=A0A9R1U2X8_9HYME|nr:PREDICTED: S-methyl-5'-thioadenosine phosphorylase [Fopius arisanus]